MINVPGSNLLDLALTIQGTQSITYSRQSGRTLLSNGMYDVTFATPVTVQVASPQPIKRTLYDQLGLDFQKNYHNFFVPTQLLDVTRGAAGDQISWNNATWEVLSTEPWFGIDGWTEALAVQLIT